MFLGKSTLFGKIREVFFSRKWWFQAARVARGNHTTSKQKTFLKNIVCFLSISIISIRDIKIIKRYYYLAIKKKLILHASVKLLLVDFPAVHQLLEGQELLSGTSIHFQENHMILAWWRFFATPQRLERLLTTEFVEKCSVNQFMVHGRYYTLHKDLSE